MRFKDYNRSCHLNSGQNVVTDPFWGKKFLKLKVLKVVLIGLFLGGCVQGRLQDSKNIYSSEIVSEKYKKVFTITGNFKQGSMTLTDYGKIQLNKAGEYLSKTSYERVIVEGHTDFVGQLEYNQILSERRAQQVKNYLVRKWKLDSSKIKTIGFGPSQPVYDNSTEQGRSLNRRVVIKIK